MHVLQFYHDNFIFFFRYRMTSKSDKCVDNTEKKVTEDCDNDFDSKSWNTITTVELNDLYKELKPNRWTVVSSVWTCILYLIDVGTDVWITSKFFSRRQYM